MSPINKTQAQCPALCSHTPVDILSLPADALPCSLGQTTTVSLAGSKWASAGGGSLPRPWPSHK